VTGPGAILEIDLRAVVANWRDLGRRHPKGPVAGVVKADAYGLGAERVVEALHAAGCRHFFVAHLAEAVRIRPHAGDALIAVLNGLLPGDEASFVDAGVTPVLGSLAEIRRWSEHASALGHALPALLHVDTGMARLGLAPADCAVLQHEPRRLRGLNVQYVMTHLVSAELPDDPLNPRQLQRFADACAVLPSAPRSVANSSGIFLGAAFGSDLARPGAALYGVNPAPGQDNPMRPVVTLRARILQVRSVAAGEGVGYNAAWRAARDSRIAVAGVGYADGWHRSLSNRGAASFDGAHVPLVGRVSMDLTTFDVTDRPAIEAGSWLELIGRDSTVDMIAAAAGTNGYEILTSLGRRYARVYRA
jgi:alanine racemase